MAEVRAAVSGAPGAAAVRELQALGLPSNPLSSACKTVVLRKLIF